MMDKRGNLGLLCDQDAGSRGLFVEFFGKPASNFKSIALLALEYEALISMGYARRMPDDFLNHRWATFEVGCEEIIDPMMCESSDPVGEITTSYSRALERVILLNPEQYFWLHRRWKSEPRKRGNRSKASAA